jgi:chemotaxis protein methyltransferase CheR
MCLAAEKQLAGWDIKILATDLDANVIGHAEAVIYSEELLSKLPEKELQWFKRGRGVNMGLVRL